MTLKTTDIINGSVVSIQDYAESNPEEFKLLDFSKSNPNSPLTEALKKNLNTKSLKTIFAEMETSQIQYFLPIIPIELILFISLTNNSKFQELDFKPLSLDFRFLTQVKEKKNLTSIMGIFEKMKPEQIQALLPIIPIEVIKYLYLINKEKFQELNFNNYSFLAKIKEEKDLPFVMGIFEKMKPKQIQALLAVIPIKIEVIRFFASFNQNKFQELDFNLLPPNSSFLKELKGNSINSIIKSILNMMSERQIKGLLPIISIEKLKNYLTFKPNNINLNFNSMTTINLTKLLEYFKNFKKKYIYGITHLEGIGMDLIDYIIKKIISTIQTKEGKKYLNSPQSVSSLISRYNTNIK